MAMQRKEQLIPEDSIDSSKKIKKLRYRDEKKGWSSFSGKKKLELVILIMMVSLVTVGVLLGVFVGLYA